MDYKRSSRKSIFPNALIFAITSVKIIAITRFARKYGTSTSTSPPSTDTDTAVQELEPALPISYKETVKWRMDGYSVLI